MATQVQPDPSVSTGSLHDYRSRDVPSTEPAARPSQLRGDDVGDEAANYHPFEPRHWVVPLDADDEVRAALEFAKWLGSGNDYHEFHGVHVPRRSGLASAEVGDAQTRGVLDDVIRTAPDTLPSDTLSNLEQVHGDPMRGLIVTRRADSTDHSLVRLGALARRLAQKASTPVAIVPHDLRELQISHGPVLLATAPSHTPAAAARLARQIAAVKRLKVLLVNVAQVEDLGAYSTNPDAFREAYQTAERNAEAHTIMWAKQHGLEHAWRQIVRGDVRFAVESAARRFDASVIICGTRQRNILERLLEPSAALEMARYATRPVILVPNDTRSEA